MTGEGLPIALIGILMALWLVGATVAIWIGLSLRRQSQKMLRQTSRLARLLETAPAFPIVVKGDGRIEAGAGRPPHYFRGATAEGFAFSLSQGFRGETDRQPDPARTGADACVAALT